MSYDELAAAAGGIATWLRANGIGRGDTVATLLARSPWCVAAALGAMAVGAAYLHIEPTDPDARVHAVLATVGVAAVLTDTADRDRLSAPATPVCAVDESTRRAPYVPADDLTPDDLAYVVLTSGSTGTPKAVEIEHGALHGYIVGFLAEIAPELPASYGITTTFAADLGNTCVYGALLTGGRLDIHDRDTTLDAESFAAELAAWPVDCLKFTPSHLAVLGRDTPLARLLPNRLLVVAGEPFPPALAADIRAARPELAVYNSYGPAEATVAALMHRVTETDTACVPIGHPMRGVRTRVTEPGGVLWIGGARLARGYRGDNELTADRFRTENGQRWYRTDDLVTDGPRGIEFTGRADRQLKIRGNRVEPAEVEAALLALPGVRRAIVTGERPTDDAPVELVAYLVGTVRPSEVTGLLHGSLPAALVPSRMHIVPAIPVGGNGKVDLAALRAAAAVDIPAAVDGDLPRTDTERMIADIWRAVLGRKRIGRDERFLEIGGDSFKLLGVFGRLRRHFPSLGIAMLFAHPTIAQLAAAVAEPGDRPTPVAAAPVVEL